MPDSSTAQGCQPADDSVANEAVTLPASFAQERLWFLHQLEPDSCAYNVPVSYDVSGPLDIEMLRRSFAEIIARHEALRTSFAMEDGNLIQVIHDAAECLFEAADLSRIPDLEKSVRADEIERRFIRTRSI